MDPITITIAIIIAAAVWYKFWPALRDWLTSSFASWVADKLSATAAQLVRQAVCFLDDINVVARRIVRKAYLFIKERVLRIKTTYTKQTSSTGTKTTEVLLHTDDGRVVKRVEEEEVAWDELPAEIRKEMMSHNTEVGEIDTREVLLHKIEEKAAAEGLLLMEV